MTKIIKKNNVGTLIFTVVTPRVLTLFIFYSSMVKEYCRNVTVARNVKTFDHITVDLLLLIGGGIFMWNETPNYL